MSKILFTLAFLMGLTIFAQPAYAEDYFASDDGKHKYYINTDTIKYDPKLDDSVYVFVALDDSDTYQYRYWFIMLDGVRQYTVINGNSNLKPVSENKAATDIWQAANKFRSHWKTEDDAF